MCFRWRSVDEDDQLTINLHSALKLLLVFLNILAEDNVSCGQDVMHTLHAALARLTVFGQHIWAHWGHQLLCHDGTEWSTRRLWQQKTLWSRNSPCGKQSDKEETISTVTNNKILNEYIQYYFFPYNSETVLKDPNMNFHSIST